MTKKDFKNLRLGFSTGTATTAAALAAARFMAEGRPPDMVEVILPGGDLYQVKILEAHKTANSFRTVVIKDAGDDPDVTNGAHIGVVLEPSKQLGLTLSGGGGVGRLTRPGLVLPPGEWAINPVPRKMLSENLANFMGPDEGLSVSVFVEHGEELASHTLNPRLGIIGGISILGTSGLVRPFSNEAYVATIDSALAVARASGLTETVLTTGGQSEKFMALERIDLPEEAFVQIADFYKDGLNLAVKHGFKTIGLAVFFGKAVKQAAGIAYTHAHKSDLDVRDLLSWLDDLTPEIKTELSESPTARAALEVLRTHGALAKVGNVARQMLLSARNFTGQKPAIWVRIFDYDGQVLAKEESHGRN